jgi:hypothetical protein
MKERLLPAWKERFALLLGLAELLLEHRYHVA